LNVGEIKDINPIEEVGFDGFWNNSVPFWHKPQIFRSDRCGTFHVSVLYLRLKNKRVIIHCIELLLLCIDESFEVTNLTEFWETMVKSFMTHMRVHTCLQSFYSVHGGLSTMQKLWLNMYTRMTFHLCFRSSSLKL
jgi:hypothetical protein